MPTGWISLTAKEPFVSVPVENASDKKGRTENFITRFARYYTPAVVFAALALAILPPVITGQSLFH